MKICHLAKILSTQNSSKNGYKFAHVTLTWMAKKPNKQKFESLLTSCRHRAWIDSRGWTGHRLRRIRCQCQLIWTQSQCLASFSSDDKWQCADAKFLGADDDKQTMEIKWTYLSKEYDQMDPSYIAIDCVHYTSI
jgi:hypothetical protein